MCKVITQMTEGPNLGLGHGYGKSWKVILVSSRKVYSGFNRPFELADVTPASRKQQDHRFRGTPDGKACYPVDDFF